jgi:hypothetical protein
MYREPVEEAEIPELEGIPTLYEGPGEYEARELTKGTSGGVS